MSSPVPPGGVLSGPGQSLRSASAVAAKPVKAFQVFRIDGFSWTRTMLPGGERVSSQPFCAGGRTWQVDLYPNGADGTKDDAAAGSVAIYLRLLGYAKGRVRVQYKFSLLDLASGDAAYELPAETATLACPSVPAMANVPLGLFANAAATTAGAAAEQEEARLGYADFITWDELERRRESLLQDDCLAIRCDVGVMELEVLRLDIKPQHNRNPYRGGGQIPPALPSWFSSLGYPSSSLSSYEHQYLPSSYAGLKAQSHHYGAGDTDKSDRDEESRRQQQPDDREYVRRCLAAKGRPGPLE